MAPWAAICQHGVAPAGGCGGRASDAPVAKRPDELAEQVCRQRPGRASQEQSCIGAPDRVQVVLAHRLSRGASHRPLGSSPAAGSTDAAVQASGWDCSAAGWLAFPAAPLATVAGRAALLLGPCCCLPLSRPPEPRSQITSRHTWCIQAERIRCDENCAGFGRFAERAGDGVTSVCVVDLGRRRCDRSAVRCTGSPGHVLRRSRLLLLLEKNWRFAAQRTSGAPVRPARQR